MFPGLRRAEIRRKIDVQINGTSSSIDLDESGRARRSDMYHGVPRGGVDRRSLERPREDHAPHQQSLPIDQSLRAGNLMLKFI